MAVQRCVWACLASSPGNDSPEYHQCVAERCAGNGAPARRAQPRQMPPLPGFWRGGLAADGRTFFAGADDPGRSGSGLYYMCDRSGQSYLMIYASDAAPGPMRLSIDGTEYRQVFDRSRVELTSNVSPGAPVFEALARSRAVAIVDPKGQVLMTLGLTGSRAALEAARRSCRGY